MPFEYFLEMKLFWKVKVFSMKEQFYNVFQIVLMSLCYSMIQFGWHVFIVVLMLSGYHADTPISIKAEAIPQGQQPSSLIFMTLLYNATLALCAIS